MNSSLIFKTVLLFLLMIILCAACSKERLQRFAYDVGTQHSCKDANENRPNESMRDLECMAPSSEKNREYDDYQQAREEEFNR